jgi:hypothetical protein
MGNTQTGGSINLGAAMTGGTITIGGTGLQTGTIGIGTGTGAQTLNFGTGTGAKTINIGTGAVANTVTIGNGTGGTSLVLNAGTGNIDIGANAIARNINLGTGAGVVQTINIGGTGANVIGMGNTQTGGSINLGAAMTGGTITIGGTGLQTGTIGIGTGTGAQILNFGTGTGAKTINIGTGAVANTLTLGNGTGNTSLTLNAGTGNIDIGANAFARTINVGTGNAIQNINLGGAAANVIGIGNTQTAGSVALGNAMTTGTITIGGTGAQTGTITLGSSTGAQTLNIGTGTGANSVNIATTGIGNTIIGNATGTVTANKLIIGGAASSYEAISRNITDGALGIWGGTSEATGAYFKITGSTYGSSPGNGSAEFVIRDFTGANASRFALWGYDGAAQWAPIFRTDGATGNTWLVPTDTYTTGMVGVGLTTGTTPTAVLHLKAGAAAASGAPLKFTSGTNLTAAEAGAVEYDGTNFFVTNSTATRYTLAKTLTNTAALDFPSTNTMLSSDLTIAVSNAALGDAVVLGIPNGSVLANSTFTAWVSIAGTVTIRFNNYSAGTLDPASGTFRVSVLKY